jgi:hypothetical protein
MLLNSFSTKFRKDNLSEIQSVAGVLPYHYLQITDTKIVKSSGLKRNNRLKLPQVALKSAGSINHKLLYKQNDQAIACKLLCKAPRPEV